jgi:hypothetical protein
MSTLLLSLLLIALVAIGLLMAVKPVREMFENPATSTIASTVISAASPTLVSLTATPTLTAQSPQVDILGRGQSLQNATDSGSSVPYSDIGVGDESSIRSWTDLTPTESAFVKDLIIKGNGDVTAPLTPPLVGVVATFRKSGKAILANMSKGDTSVENDDGMTIEEFKLFMSGREAAGTPANTPPSDAEKAMIVNRRKAYLAKQAPSVKSIASIAQSSAATSSGLSLTPDETAAVLKMRKEAAVKQARALVAQEEPVNSNPTNRRRAKGDEDYEDDYSGYAAMSPSQRRRMNREPRNYERDHGDDCPDMSQYIKLDEIPCWNCTLP